MPLGFYSYSGFFQNRFRHDRLPEYKISSLLLFLKGMQFDDDMEDDLYCQKLYEDYLSDPDPEKHETITLEELAAQEGIEL